MITSITEAQFNIALGNLLQAMLPQFPAGQIIVGQVNRVASPLGDYVVFWPLRRPRLGTDVENPIDAVFTGTITPIDSNTSTLNITAVNPNFTGQIAVNSQIFGIGIALPTIVTALGTGTGGIGTYIVTPSQTIGSETLAAGFVQFDQATEVVTQIEVHGPASGDNAQVIQQLFRSEFAVSAMSGTGITPLFVDPPRQVPFITAASQYENRWIIDAHFDCAPIISIPQEFASAATVNVVSVTAAYH